MIDPNADAAYESLRDDFDESLPDDVRRAICSEEWWERFREFIANRATSGKPRRDREASAAVRQIDFGMRGSSGAYRHGADRAADGEPRSSTEVQ